MVIRIVVLVAVILAALAVTALAARVRPRGGAVVPHGLTLVVAAGCHTCESAKHAFDAIGHRYRTIDVAEAAAFGVSSYTVPYAMVGDRTGRVTMVRRGPAVVTDAAALAAVSLSG